MSSDPTAPKPKRQKTEDRLATLEAELAEAQKTSDNHLTQLKYARADLDNLQKQTQRRVEEATYRAAARTRGELLTIADELSFAVSEGHADGGGVKMIHCKLLKLLESEGVKPIEAYGKPFDPYRHEAVLEVETLEQPAGTVVEEIRKGYTYKDKVLRASVVKVAKAPNKKEEA